MDRDRDRWTESFIKGKTGRHARAPSLNKAGVEQAPATHGSAQPVPLFGSRRGMAADGSRLSTSACIISLMYACCWCHISSLLFRKNITRVLRARGALCCV